MYALMSTVTEYATAMGSSATIAGLVSGIYVFGGLCSRIYSGNALEKKGWKKIALIFMSIHFLACLLYFIVDDVNLLLIVRFIHGIGFGASANAVVTIATAILPSASKNPIISPPHLAFYSLQSIFSPNKSTIFLNISLINILYFFLLNYL